MPLFTFVFQINTRNRFIHNLFMRTILLAFVLQTVFATIGSAQVYYTVKFPDDRIVYGCGAKADTIWPQITKTGNCGFNVGVSVKDEVFYTNGTGCGKVLRTWKLNWWCDYDPNWSPTLIQNPTNTDVGPTVQGTPTNHGFLQYTQIIKFLDQAAPVFIGCPTGAVTFCDLTTNDPAQYGSLCEGPAKLETRVTDACSKSNIMLSYRLYLDLDGNGSMETFLSSSNPAAWPIETSVQGDTVTGKIKFPTGHGFPYGKHKIEWIANDNCGNESLCKYEFIVKDCKPPTVVCINGLSINIMQTGMITLWDTDFLKYTSDNCTPDAQLKIAIRKAGTGTGFPLNNHSVTFDCTELGKQAVEVWSQDAYGNADYCITYVIVQDNAGTCPPPNSPTGKVKTALNKPLAGVKMTLQGPATNPGPWAVSTDAEGAYAFALGLPACNVTLTASFDSLTKMGVNTLDALLAAAHIAGIQPFGSPYQIIAADVNHDGILNGEDLLDIIQVVTGQTGKFPENTAWMFVPETFVFQNPANPFATLFPEKMILQSPQCYKNEEENFVAVKTGDVNDSANPNQLSSTDAEDRAGEAVVFMAPKSKCQIGTDLRVPIQTPLLGDLAAFQISLEYDPNYLVLDHVEAGLIPSAWTGIFPDQHLITGSWHNAAALDSKVIWPNERQTAFTLVFRVVQNGSLSKALKMSSAQTSSEAYTRKLTTLGATLDFIHQKVTQPEPYACSVYPNPVQDEVTAMFFLDEPSDVAFTLSDPAGNVLHSTNNHYSAGFQSIKIDLPGSTNTGMLFLQMKTPEAAIVKKVIVQR